MEKEEIKHFNTVLQEFVYIRTYSRWKEDEQRRETWEETVTRYVDFMKKKYGDKISAREYNEVYNAILNLEVMPSMRALWSAGPAAENDNLAIYNCSFLAIEKLKDFAEIMYILMNGTGVGFSIERKYVYKLPEIKFKKTSKQTIQIIFDDSKLGWALGFEQVLNALWEGIPFEVDLSQIRPRGARLKTFGGRASGPEPLKNLIDFVSKIVEENRGSQLRPIDIHDICCKIADIVVVGGTRRSALISLSNLSDNQMAAAKTGEFWISNSQRRLSNNSVAYTRKPDIISFIDEWKNLIQSGTGERGIFNRIAAVEKANENNRRDGSQVVGINPCGEVLLRSRGLCNLTEVVVRPNDDFDSLKRKVKIATLMGTWQAGFTDFKYIDLEWKRNAEEERLLGVSLTGTRDHPILGVVSDKTKKWLSDLKHIAIAQNKKIAQKIEINRSAAITCVKPSGTVSVLVDSAPGCHMRITKSGHYIRRIRISATDPLFKMLKAQGIPYVCEAGETPDRCSTYVLEFPAKAPKEAILKTDATTVEDQLQYWKMFKDFWCEHNPSVTIYVKEHEWLTTANWVYKNFNEIGGLTFLPDKEHIYQLPPIEDIDKETYDKMIKGFPKIDFTKLLEYEKEDQTIGARELACSGDSCAII